MPYRCLPRTSPRRRRRSPRINSIENLLIVMITIMLNTAGFVVNDTNTLKNRTIKRGFNLFKLPHMSRRRPDIIININSMFIIIEIDEHGHINYSKSDDLKRYADITNDLHRYVKSRNLSPQPVHWVRFNPDRYSDKTGQYYYESCRDGSLITNMKDYNIRINALFSVVSNIINNITLDTVFFTDKAYLKVRLSNTDKPNDPPFNVSNSTPPGVHNNGKRKLCEIIPADPLRKKLNFN